MFLALREIKKEKFRYGLVVAVITLTAYLIFILSALALGLSNENTIAVNSWQTKSIILSKDANGDLTQSLLTVNNQANYSGASQDLVGLAPGILKQGAKRDAATFIGVPTQSAITSKIQLTKGRLWHKSSEVVLSSKLADQGLKIGQKITLGLNSQQLTVVGFAKSAEYNMAPIVYGDLSQWAAVKGVNPSFIGSGYVSHNQVKIANNNLQDLTKKELFNKMPGYSAQNKTFVFMIVFLVIISIVIVTIFLYILTVQKMANLAVLRAQGIPSRYLLWNTLAETLMIMVLAVLTALILAAGTGEIMPAAVPMFFSLSLMTLTGLAMVLMGLLGAVVPMQLIAKIDPVTVIGG
ncbi:ABC transporter permease [Fructobacillus ficulneus]|uniref:Putative hemin transport system permease protein HrtB n=1 Tax=Fructobacillus ficulneus TaxID=157463 RepID=A0A0K8MG94_9LACO|nr:FtsX-like permease family protein [Fructobacillus ficulneus]GAO99477.1 putative ABC transporter permease protein [Fructobacillus ficulneus]